MPDAIDWKQLYALGKKVLIWGVFFVLLYILSDLFALVFFTFILAFIASRLSEYAVEHLNVTRRFAITVVYLILVLTIFGLGYLIVPRVFQESRQFARDLPGLEAKINNTIQEWRVQYTEFAPILNTYADPARLEAGLKKFTDQALKALPNLIENLAQGLLTVVLSIIFSFLIVIDIARLRRDIKRLKDTRLHDFFQETARPIVVFGGIVGRAFEAQTFIAIVNTILTVLGMMILGVPKVALLGIIVFLCSFVPVLGVLISSVPILLVSFNASGVWLALGALIMVLVVHTLEAYVINPRIYAHHMKMNPVLVLIVLFLGHHLFGIWGVLLAVPVTHYFITHVAGLKPRAIRRRGTPAATPTDGWVLTPVPEEPEAEGEGTETGGEPGASSKTPLPAGGRRERDSSRKTSARGGPF